MRKVERETIALRIGKALHDLFAGVVKEPVPERWVDLINYLNAQEEEQRQAETSPYDRRRSLTH